jgi:hypothetical protein
MSLFDVFSEHRFQFHFQVSDGRVVTMEPCAYPQISALASIALYRKCPRQPSPAPLPNSAKPIAKASSTQRP